MKPIGKKTRELKEQADRIISDPGFTAKQQEMAPKLRELALHLAQMADRLESGAENPFGALTNEDEALLASIAVGMALADATVTEAVREDRAHQARTS